MYELKMKRQNKIQHSLLNRITILPKALGMANCSFAHLISQLFNLLNLRNSLIITTHYIILNILHINNRICICLAFAVICFSSNLLYANDVRKEIMVAVCLDKSIKLIQ